MLFMLHMYMDLNNLYIFHVIYILYFSDQQRRKMFIIKWHIVAQKALIEKIYIYLFLKIYLTLDIFSCIYIMISCTFLRYSFGGRTSES